MRLLSYSAQGTDRAGVAANGGFADAGGLLGRGPISMLDLIDGGPDTLAALREALTSAGDVRPFGQAQLHAPIARTRRNVFCVGWNYSEHFAEGQQVRADASESEIPPHPTFFSKNPATIVGPDEDVLHPAPLSQELDWEVELAVVIGLAGRDITEERALEHVLGYTVANDVSVRDHQRLHGGQWFKGKNFDTHLPLGPWIVTADEIPDPQHLRITSRVNGATKQDSNTDHMVFSIRRILRELSAGLTLEPGDVILTGTPEGVGFARKPPEFLGVGDVMEMEVERIGVLRNRVVAGPVRE